MDQLRTGFLIRSQLLLVSVLDLFSLHFVALLQVLLEYFTVLWAGVNFAIMRT